jgi:phosphocarrier protein
MADRSVVRKRFQIVNRLGLHARAAAQLVQLADKFVSELTIARADQVVNGKSIMGLMMLAAAQGSTVDITAQGEDAAEMVAAIGALIEAKFNEPQ